MKLTRRPCPACGHQEISRNISADELRYWQEVAELRVPSTLSFIGRQRPQPSPWLWVQCPDCTLSFVALAPDESWLSEIYHKSGVTSAAMDEWAALNALRVWQQVMADRPERSSVLDFGCGRGHFLHLLKQQDPQVQRVLGIEINTDLREQNQLSPHELVAGLQTENDRQRITETPNRWSVLSAQLSLEHLMNPDLILQGLIPYLSDPSYCFFLYHDGEGFAHQILAEDSPLFDIQHLQLFNAVAMETFLARHGFQVLLDQRYCNQYPMSYWLTLLGIDERKLPHWLFPILQRKSLSLYAGNRVVLARHTYQTI